MRFYTFLSRLAFFLFFSVILYTLWWHKPRFGDSWENIWGLCLLLCLAYICLSFSIQAVLLSGQLARRELCYNLSLPRFFVPSTVCLRHAPASELVLEVQLPNILFGVQVFWELRLRNIETGQKLCLRYRLRSGHNSLKFPLDKAEPWLLAQFQHGLYKGANQCFYVRDCFAALHLRYRIQQALELAVLSSANLCSSCEALSSSMSKDPLSSAVQKLAQEGRGEQRPYYPGDDPRRINWKLYSRFNELHVRIPEEQPVFSQDLHCYFVLDMSCYPKRLRESVLSWASIYFLNQLKQLHQKGYRIITHIPCFIGSQTDSLPLEQDYNIGQGILYHESSEERILHLLASYQRNIALVPINQQQGISNKFLFLLEYSKFLNKMKIPFYREPYLNLQQFLVAQSTGSTANNLVFVSPHSLSYHTEILAQYFSITQTQYIPLPEPSASLRETLLCKNIIGLLPFSLLWGWLLQGRQRLQEGSRALQLYRNLGLPLNQVITLKPAKQAKMKTKTFIHRPLKGQRYPQLLLLLWQWKRYYQQPSRHYSVKRWFRNGR